MTTRRSFLASAAAAAASPSLFAAKVPFKLGVATYSLRKLPRTEAIAVIKKLGIEYVSIKDTVASFKEILEGKADDLPEQAFFLAGTLDQVRENAARLGAG